uniref:Nuclear export mediator factor Nemf n=1 Tax=Rhizophora mucronata TaxID=61149 RepID=A0A2P2KC86_RHIMU
MAVLFDSEGFTSLDLPGFSFLDFSGTLFSSTLALTCSLSSGSFTDERASCSFSTVVRSKTRQNSVGYRCLDIIANPLSSSLCDRRRVKTVYSESVRRMFPCAYNSKMT